MSDNKEKDAGRQMAVAREGGEQESIEKALEDSPENLQSEARSEVGKIEASFMAMHRQLQPDPEVARLQMQSQERQSLKNLEFAVKRFNSQHELNINDQKHFGNIHWGVLITLIMVVIFSLIMILIDKERVGLLLLSHTILAVLGAFGGYGIAKLRGDRNESL